MPDVTSVSHCRIVIVQAHRPCFALRPCRMADRIPIIMNPAARSAKAARVVARMAALSPAPEMHFTEYPGHATQIAEKLAREGRELVVAAGGDGTVNEVLQGLSRVNAERPDIGHHTALGTLPAGTMNVFAYEMGYPSHRELKNPWQVMTSGTRRFVDLWMANEQYFVQLAGVGPDAEIVRRTTWAMKKAYGPLSYAISAVHVLTSQAPILTVRTPDRPDLHGRLVLVGNGRNYGGRFHLFRDAKMADGLLDVIIFREPVNPWNAAQMLRGSLLDGFRSSEDIDYLQLAEFTVSAAAETAVQLDGELSGSAPVTFRRAPFPLRVAA